MPAQCVIMSDSTCDLSAARARELDVRILPFHYVEADKPNGGLSGDDDLFSTISAHEFYEAIRRGAAPFTSQPSQLEFEHAYEEVHAAGVPAVLFTITPGLSGGYEGALMALKRFKEVHADEEVKIWVVDTSVASTPMNLFVEQACALRDEGKTAEEIVEWAEEAKWRLHTIFMVDNLNALHRGGRVPKSVALIGDALDVKPLLTFNLKGELSIMGVVRGRKKGLRKLAQHYERTHDDGAYGQVVAVGDADCSADGYALAATLTEEFPGLRVLRSTIGPTIGAHVGPGMISCCFWGADRRDEKNRDDVGDKRVKGIRKG